MLCLRQSDAICLQYYRDQVRCECERIMKDDPTFNIKFVETIEKYRVLYDRSLDQYLNRQHQEKTWEDVGREFNETGVACKEKWKNIRSAFSRHLRQTLNGSSGKPKKPYYLAKYLDFLLPYSKSRSQNSSTVTSSLVEDDQESDTSNDIDQINVDNLNNSEGSNHTEILTYDNDSEFEEPVDKKRKIKTTPKNYRDNAQKQEFSGIDPLEECSLEYFRSKDLKKECEDPDLQFFKSILPDIHAMNHQQKYQFKMRTLQIIGELLYGPSSKSNSFPANSMENV